VRAAFESLWTPPPVEEVPAVDAGDATLVPHGGKRRTRRSAMAWS